MKIIRRFTQSGRDVYAQVEWAQRSSRISNPDGSVVFEMNDVQVPAGWSQLATDIMVSKYFRKAGVPQPDGTTGPERSAKEVIHRLAGCWRHWGEQHGYFDSTEDAQAFYDELAWMMLAQIAAPNSPQWFNTGLHWAYGINGPAQGHYYTDPATGETRLSEDSYTHPQPHACFIQSIEDDLVNSGGIMDLWVREARLFKYGSGTGTNFSRLRGENEKLSGGGRSSGLMSFLKIGDRAAGAIKSGGTTRRAAKMVCLDLDHPDIEHFVNWKVREELKVAAMVEGLKRLAPEQRQQAEKLGLKLDYDFNGEAYQTVSGQNSNNSVRVPNRFFRCLDEDGAWELTWRTTDKVAKTVRARDLWEQIGFAAWRCADPGVQFDTTINEWHTCPASGRINASNPCVTGDTLVATTTGYRRIAELVGQTVEIINGDGQKVWVDRVFKTGHKPVYELKTRSGYRLKLTADHRVKTANRGDVQACELTTDDVVLLEKPGFGDDFVPETFGELIGAAVGDGCIAHDASQDFLFVSLGANERPIAERLRDGIDECKRWLNEGDARGLRETVVTATATGLRVGTSVGTVLRKLQSYAVLDAGSAGKRLTGAAFALDRRSQAAILRGLFTTDGTVAHYGEKSQYIALDSTSLELLQQVQLLLLGFGIKAKIYENRRALGCETAMLPDGKGGLREYPVQQVHSLRITRASRFIFEEQIGFMPGSTKADRLATMNCSVRAYREQLVDRVRALTPCGVEDVFDLTEPRSHHFVANGIVVHNCSEYMFLDNTACNLASINLLKLYDSKTRTFDIAGYEHAIDLWTVVLEISVLMAQYPSKEIARLSYEYRTLGLGYANLGAMLMQAGVPYDSELGRAIGGTLAAVLTGRSYATSAQMAAEHGPFPGYFKNREAMLRVIRNHRRAAYGVPRDEARTGHELGDYEGLEVKPVPIDADWMEGKRRTSYGGIANGAQILHAARKSWDEALKLGQQHGFRNAQTTVIAPTGTIGLLMDCDTTGVEPDFALVKFKKLAGGGYFKIANQSLRPALVALGYSDTQVRDILTYVMGRGSLEVPMPSAQGEVAEGAATFADFLRHKGLDKETLTRLTEALKGAMELSFVFNGWTLGEETIRSLGLAATDDLLRGLGLTRKQVDRLNELICGTGTVEGSAHLKEEHYAVFDCANKCGRKGQRFIAPQGHIRMMAAVQPFISGAISKTINLPNDASVDDIKAAYRLSWELGIKANALYRDGSKLSQPLNVVTDAEVEDEEAIEAGKEEVSEAVVLAAARSAAVGSEASAAAARAPVEKIVERIVERPMRRRLPNTRRSLTHKFNVAGHEGYLTVGLYEDGSPGELFITMAKEGSTIGGIMDSLGTAISVALQYGVPIDSLVQKFSHQRFEPNGMTDNPDIPFAKSLVDYIFRWMGMEFITGYRAANAPKREPKPAAPAAREPVEAESGRLAGELRKAGNGHGNGHGNGGRIAAIDDPHLITELASRSNPLDKLAVKTHEVLRLMEKEEITIGVITEDPLSAANRDMMADAPPCDVCGSITIRNGACYKCVNCGTSQGCS